ncbi:Sporulation related domain-containing protein [Sphingomonas guangdongensis]|uniref:Sporulation related domain-containing protein n=1 Tax=Sphingomonas guangdongensis TaxID=1141890 RepID=A0A285QYH1_9SPHN|nr:SPOR domain-containing protein [Sphingomonas guangdongensis]SOB86881.1 Sporulation related domain-containing protein [Sphingomonas guangdongensis]
MTDGRRTTIGDDDRLPWLESADDDYREGSSPLRVILLVLAGLGLIAAGIWAYGRFAGRPVLTGSGELIAAPEGDYKVRPDEPGGMKVEGEGDSVFSTSEGARKDGQINTAALPEAPVEGRKAPATPKAGAGAAQVVTPVPEKGGRLTAQAPRVALPNLAAGGGGGSLVQLGSFPNEAMANTAWTTASKRFGYLTDLGKSVEKAEVGGRTVYRLRVNAGSNGNAKTICGKLKVAGEACFVP